MSVSGITSSSSPYPNTVQDDLKQRADDFKALKTALQSGDLSASQSAFAAFKQDIQNTKQPPANSQPSQDFQALESALSSGDISSAQKAFASLQSDVKGAHKAHHHHHHKSDGGSDTQIQTGASNTSGTVGTILNQQA